MYTSMVGEASQTSQRTRENYLVAILSVAVAWIARSMLTPILGVATPMLLFTLAIAVSAYRGGLGPGLLATFLGGGLGAIFFIPNLWKLSSQVGLVLFFAVNASIVAVCEGLRRSRQRVIEKEQAAEVLLGQVAENRAILDGMFETAPIGMGVYDRELRFVRLNAALAEINGIPLQEHFGKTVYELLPDLEPRVFDAFRRVFELGQPVFDVEMTGYTPARPGILRAWACSYYPVKTDGNVRYCAALVHEITEKRESDRALKEFNRRLAQSNDDLRQFAYATSHDLQEPLRMVTSSTQLLSRRYGAQLDEQAQIYIRYAVDGAYRMENLLHGLRDYWNVSEVEVAQPEQTDSDVVLDRALSYLQLSIRDSNAVITRDPLPGVLMDEIPLLQLFQNVLSNAVKYRHPDRQPRIHIGAIAQEDQWIFSVKDNGIGIDAQYAQQVFGIFKRLNGYKYGGAGIGLAICQKIVERFGGRIWVESQLGSGATFFFTLPHANVTGRDQRSSLAPAAGSHR